MDAIIGALLEKVQGVSNKAIGILEHMGSLKHELKIVEKDKQVLEDTLATLENSLASMISSCSDATSELEFETKNVLLQLDSDFKIEKLDWKSNVGVRENEFDASAANQQLPGTGDYVKVAENFLLATRKVQTLIKQFTSTKCGLDTTIDDLKHELKLTRISLEECANERDLNQNEVLELKTNLESSQSLCSELTLELEGCQERENKLKERLDECTREKDLNQSKVCKLEGDLESSQSLCSELKLQLEDCDARENRLNERVEECTKERDANQIKVSKLETDLELSKRTCSELRFGLEAHRAKENESNERAGEEHDTGDILTPSQMRSLCDKISEIKIFAEIEDAETHGSNFMEKLYRLIESVNDLHEQNNMLSHDKKELESLVERHASEIERLTEEVDGEATCKTDSEEMKREFSNILLHLEKIILKVGGNKISEKQNPSDVKKLLSALEQLVADLNLESETSKSKVQELGTMLLGSQKAVEDLSVKVKSLEQLHQSQTVSPGDVVQERSIYEGPLLPSGSEITEIEDAGSIGKNTPPPASLATQMRTLRKGSTDHLALSIDSESDRLIDGEKEDEDKRSHFQVSQHIRSYPKTRKNDCRSS